ncbi:FxSxx-COOH system tetratricopeptide repeat protein [Actinoplanes sp. NPDC049681]|uniref:FxSxx-COOH system tetratricopeptide repeat protein n=1 Tax=Actinoplanes sp. NPDC049681 TaxID=3363905 RepID=UPI0037A6B980
MTARTPASIPPASPSDPDGRVDVFVNHAGRDRAWAEWVAWELVEAGFTVELDYWDWEVGENFVEKMRDALQRADRMVALFSEAYFEPQRHTSPELAALLADRSPARKRLIPVRIEPVTPPLLYAPLLSIDVFGVPEDHARQQLIEAVRGKRRPDGRPEFPGSHPTATDAGRGSGPRRPGSLPPVWNVPPRNAAFTGRDRMIVDLRDRLLSGGQVLVQALHGMGGVGKTQLAVEYAHRFAGEYELVWWINSENPALIGEQLASLAVAAGLVLAGTDVAAGVAAVQGHLRCADRVLLVFDNVEKREDIRPWLPGGPAHILVTSRNPLWSDVAQTMSVDVFARPESVAFLQANLPDLAVAEADQLAQALGDLPLAIAQTGDLLAETGMGIQRYLTALDQHAAELLDGDSPPGGYPVSLAAAVTVAADRLAADAPAAGQLLSLCAYLAPDPIPLDLFTGDADLPLELAAAADSFVALARAAGRLSRYGLARTTTNGLQLHRLTQAVLRDTDPQPAVHRGTVERLLIAAQPDDGTNPALWPRWSVLLPHILACDPAGTANTQLRWLVFSAGWHLLARGDARTALPLAEQLHTAWTQRLGPDELTTLNAARLLSYAHRALGHYEEARRLDEDVLERYRRVLGDDHPDTLSAAHSLAADLRRLREYEQARRLDEDVLERYRRVLGDDHPHTLISIQSLATDLRELGEYEQARRLDEDVLERRRRVLGDDHPHTHSSTQSLAIDLHELGEFEQARRLGEDVLERYRRVLGDDHPDTLSAAHNLAGDLLRLREYEQARRLDEDVLERYRRVLGDDHPHTHDSIQSLATDLYELGEYEQARRLGEDVLERRRRVLGDDHPDTLSAAHNLAIYLYELGEYEQACRLGEDVLERRRRVLGDDHPNTLSSAFNLAGGLRELGEYEQARRLDEDVLERRRRVLGDDHPDTLSAAHNVAMYLRQLGEQE